MQEESRRKLRAVSVLMIYNCIQHPKTCSSIGDDAGERLVDLVGDRIAASSEHFVNMVQCWRIYAT